MATSRRRRWRSPAEPVPDPLVVILGQGPKAHVELVGESAAALSALSRARLGVPRGVILTTALTSAVTVRSLPEIGYVIPGNGPDPFPALPLVSALTSVWHEVARGGVIGVNVTPAGDRTGRFHELPIRRWDGFLSTVRAAAEVHDPPVPVRVQRPVDAVLSGTVRRLGPSRRSPVELQVDSGAGVRSASVTVVDRFGRELTEQHQGSIPLAPSVRQQLARLANDVDRCLGGTNETTWAVTASGADWVLDVVPADERR